MFAAEMQQRLNIISPIRIGGRGVESTLWVVNLVALAEKMTFFLKPRNFS